MIVCFLTPMSSGPPSTKLVEVEHPNLTHRDLEDTMLQYDGKWHLLTRDALGAVFAMPAKMINLDVEGTTTEL